MTVVAVEHEPTLYNSAHTMTHQPTVPKSAKKTYWGRARAWVSILLIVPVGIVLILSQPPLPAGSSAQLAYDVLGCMLRWMWVPLLCQFLIILRNQSWWSDYIHIP